jgi:hypothetical protein
MCLGGDAQTPALSRNLNDAAATTNGSSTPSNVVHTPPSASWGVISAWRDPTGDLNLKQTIVLRGRPAAAGIIAAKHS